jgi:hypothetical protein
VTVERERSSPPLRYHRRMTTARMPFAWRRFVRAPRTWLLWLALLVAAGHSLATWHPYTHTTSELAAQAAGKHALSACDVCLTAAAALGAAPPMVPPALALAATEPALQPLPVAAMPHAPVRRPYAIRAPPLPA